VVDICVWLFQEPFGDVVTSVSVVLCFNFRSDVAAADSALVVIYWLRRVGRSIPNATV